MPIILAYSEIDWRGNLSRGPLVFPENQDEKHEGSDVVGWNVFLLLRLDGAKMRSRMASTATTVTTAPPLKKAGTWEPIRDNPIEKLVG